MFSEWAGPRTQRTTKEIMTTLNDVQECTCKMDKSLNRGMLNKFESRKICVAGYQCDNSDFDFALRNTAGCL